MTLVQVETLVNRMFHFILALFFLLKLFKMSVIIIVKKKKNYDCK